MGMYDTVLGIPDGYDSQFKCWDCLMLEYNAGDEIPPVGIAKSYSIELSTIEKKNPPGFLIVTDGRLVNLLAHDPAHGAPVFDKWGKYLGHGGQMLERPVHPIEQALTNRPMMSPWTVKEAKDKLNDEEAPVHPEYREKREVLTHQLRLRHDFMVKVKLPPDLSENEAERLSLWMQSLPFDK